jgi:hypothetical protein
MFPSSMKILFCARYKLGMPLVFAEYGATPSTWMVRINHNPAEDLSGRLRPYQADLGIARFECGAH